MNLSPASNLTLFWLSKTAGSLKSKGFPVQFFSTQFSIPITQNLITTHNLGTLDHEIHKTMVDNIVHELDKTRVDREGYF